MSDQDWISSVCYSPEGSWLQTSWESSTGSAVLAFHSLSPSQLPSSSWLQRVREWAQSRLCCRRRPVRGHQRFWRPLPRGLPALTGSQRCCRLIALSPSYHCASRWSTPASWHTCNHLRTVLCLHHVTHFRRASSPQHSWWPPSVERWSSHSGCTHASLGQSKCSHFCSPLPWRRNCQLS